MVYFHSRKSNVRQENITAIFHNINLLFSFDMYASSIHITSPPYVKRIALNSAPRGIFRHKLFNCAHIRELLNIPGFTELSGDCKRTYSMACNPLL